MKFSIPKFLGGQSINNERGTYFMFTAAALVVIMGFTALGIEVARWHAIQGEMSKAIDGAAFAGAQNVNNPAILNTVGLNPFVQQVAQANFPPGLLGTTTPNFVVTNDGNGRITVNGTTQSVNTIATAYDTSLSHNAVAAAGSAKLRLAEIALVLDVSGSMSGAIGDLRDGSTTFVQNFVDQQSDNQFALISFASGVQTQFDLDHDYVNDITSDIGNLSAFGWTNSEDAIEQANALPWSDQSGVAVNEKTMQAVVFFSDGNPTAFRDDFTYKDVVYDGVAAGGGNISGRMYNPNFQHSDLSSHNDTDETGDGKDKNNSACGSDAGHTTKWHIFSDPTYGLDSFGPTSGLDPETCLIQDPGLLGQYHDNIVRRMAIDNAQALKDRGVLVYTIGLGNVDQNFLQQISSGPEYAFYTPDSSELDGIFQTIANILKLVLVG